jgi:hypothetical protein
MAVKLCQLNGRTLIGDVRHRMLAPDNCLLGCTLCSIHWVLLGRLK